MKETARVVGVAVLLLLLYLSFSGAITGADLLMGSVAAVVISLLVSDLLVSNAGKLIDLRRWAYLVVYGIKYLTVIELKAHWSVIKAILNLGRVNPSIVRVPVRVRSDYAKTTVANSITNTPGTVVVDVDEERNYFYVHWLFADVVEDEEARRSISEEFERFSSKIFD